MSKATYYITVDGRVSTVMPQNKRTFELEEAQKLVDGLIEVVPLTKDLIMIINEEGKYTKRMNAAASMIARECGSIYEDDYICGDVIICPSRMLP